MSFFKNSCSSRTCKITFLELAIGFMIIQHAYAVDKIVFPWRAASHIVKQRSEFEILFNQDGSAPIDSVILTGPYSRAVCKISSSEKGAFVYDLFTLEAANIKIKVIVPADTPEDMYDIHVHSAGNVSVSKRSLKVVQEFKTKYTLLHITDTHITRNWVGIPEDGFAEELILMDKLVEVINIIGPDLVINTGDCIMDYTRLNPDESGWGGSKQINADEAPYIDEKWDNYYEGANGLRGLQAMNAPTFSLPGNHDFYGVSSSLDKAKQWNENSGLRVYGFSYGSTRYLMADDFLGDQKEYADVFTPYLQDAGGGDLRIVGHHAGGDRDLDFFNANTVGLELYGHSHEPDVGEVGNTPTVSMRAGGATRTDWKDLGKTGFYRIIWIDNGNVTWSDALQFSADPHLPHDEIETMLTLDYPTPTEVSIQNKYDIDLPAVKVRLVLPKGNYEPDIGQVEQIFENDTATIIDVRIDLDKQNTTEISMIKNTGTGRNFSSSDVSQSFNANIISGILQTSFFLPHPAKVKIMIFQTNGRHIRTLKKSNLPQGKHHLEWQGLNFYQRGIYFFQVLVTPEKQNTPTTQMVKKLFFM